MNRILTLFIISLAAGLAYLLWPLTSSQFVINWDKRLFELKKTYLQYHEVTNFPEKKPNIVVILVDDLGKTDITLYGPGKVETPHIDAIGREGIIFEQAYVTSPVCSPSRAAIFTGRYPQRFGFTYQMHDFYLTNRLMHYGYRLFIDSSPWRPRSVEQVPSRKMAEKQGMPPSEITLGELLKKEGYHTALIGKWHLGGHEQNTPCNFGFDFQYGFYASHSLYAYEDNPGIISQQISNDFSDKYIWKGQRDGPHAIYRNCEIIREEEYLTQAITRECINFIESNQDTSFFLVASYNAPHTPLQAPAEYVEQYNHIQDPVKRVYYAMIRSLDDEIGKLMESVRQIDHERKTLVFFISDNGGATYTHTTDNAPLRGGKITDFEGGVNVPMIMYWKDHVPEGIKYPHPVSAMDIFGTITSVLEIDLPGDRTYDGINLLEFIEDGETGQSSHSHIFWNRGNTKSIRSPHYKLILNTEFGDTLLFDMSENNLERKNVLNENRETALDLIEQYDRWEMNLKKPLWPPLIYYVHTEKGKNYYFDN
ncbi:MAG: sulfatase-like hydrolase/transferase [Cyclobacteriaceae bacterium]|nr:sulfatase-like hydrolase/transferase [Cyclobacteriaceae bacterium]